MANSHNIFPCFYILSLLAFCALHILATSDDFPDHNFINCGSAANLTLYGKTFTGDGEHLYRYELHSGDGAKVEDAALHDELYRTARVFRKSSYYEFRFNADENGTYAVRLHFFPFPSMGNLSDARFNVSTQHLTLLVLSKLDFESSNLPLIKEFFVKVSTRKLRISFVPDKRGKRSFSFINAIEVFLTPLEFFEEDELPRVSREKRVGSYHGVFDSPLRVVHRINVGDRNVTRDMDTMKRLWISDAAYLLPNSTAINKLYDGRIYYRRAMVSDAPEAVYNTAREIKIDDGRNSSNFNISWRFEVTKDARHLVRLHFCNIVSRTPDESIVFNLHIYGDFSKEVYPWNLTGGYLAVPFYMDFVVDSDYSGYMNISVGPSNNPEFQFQTAFLNGLEIMEMITSVDRNDSTGKGLHLHLHMIIGWSIGVVVLVTMVLIAFISFLRRNKWGASSHKSKTSVGSVAGSIHADLNLGLKVPLSSILFATRNFNAKLIIGEGGFGKVYKGKLMRRGTKVAIKRSEPGHGQGLEEFHTEIRVLSKIRHQHLVSLIGFCDERDEMILVYEFMEKGTLRDHLYALQGEVKTASPFSWDQRLRICICAARGLDYLHTGCHEAIVHRDIKSTNILLDENYVAKVADFGLSRMVPDGRVFAWERGDINMVVVRKTPHQTIYLTYEHSGS